MHADDPDHAAAAVLGDTARDLLRLDPGIGLVHGHDVDRQIGAKQLPLGGALGETVDRGERVRRHGRTDPLHDIAVVVIMRRLDQDELKARLGRRCPLEHPSIPKRGGTPRERIGLGRPNALYL